MDWLIRNSAAIELRIGKLKFKNILGKKVVTTGKWGDPKLQLVTTTKMLKACHEKQMVFAVKLNPIDKPKSPNEPEWLSKFKSIFPEDLTELPPPREVDHEI